MLTNYEANTNIATGRLMPSKLASRDARAIKRARAAELRKAARIAAAQRQEDRDEAIAPSAQRKPVVGADGEVVRAARVERDGVAFRRANPLSHLLAHIERGSSHFTAAHIAALRRLQIVWDSVHGGAGIGASDWGSLRGTRGTAPTAQAGHNALIEQVAQQVELEFVRTHLGALWPCIQGIVLEARSIKAWAEKVELNPKVANGFFLAALELLVDIYKRREVEPERKTRIRTVEFGDRSGEVSRDR